MVNLKDLAKKDDLFVSGHDLCPGCGIPVILKIVLRTTNNPIIAANASGCLQSASTTFPATSWRLNWIHTAMENAAATMSGIQAACSALKKQGKLPGEKEINFLVIGGDGSTYDTGLRSISSAMERGENFVYLCYDNQMYACSGGQRSSASPMGAATATTPSGKILPGKLQPRKNIVDIFAAHKIPYVAQSAPWLWQDLYRKAGKAFEIPGPAFINVLTPCPYRWKIPTNKSIEITKLAVDTCAWPIYEIENGTKVTVNYKPKKKLPVTAWLQPQARFTHLFKAENNWIVKKIQEEIDEEWNFLLSSENKNRIN
ncbi:MAG: thiamine pyrophosphate-dependent enzyme [Candidatus Aminicenantes bacterium]|nr:thiamine pyrophosphate-dependent enzyme [Candidatus Aminicenantes bacterium]